MRHAPHSSLPARLTLCVAAMLLAACAPTRVDSPLTVTAPGQPPIAPIDFWHELNARPVTSYDEAFHGLLLLIDGEDDSAGYEARVEKLRSRGLLPGSFDRPGDEAAQRGAVAVVLAKALQIKGGLFMHVTGGHERYAVRELAYINVYPASSPRQTFTGAEFVAVIGRAEDYMRSHPKAEKGT